MDDRIATILTQARMLNEDGSALYDTWSLNNLRTHPPTRREMANWKKVVESGMAEEFIEKYTETFRLNVWSFTQGTVTVKREPDPTTLH